MVIDMHSHWMPPRLADALRARSDRPRIIKDAAGREHLEMQRGAVPLDVNFANAHARIQLMDEMGVAVSVLSLSGIYGVEQLPIEESLPLVRMFNDELSEVCRQYPQRFHGIAVLPVADLDESAREFDRAMRLPGIIGALIPGNGFLTLERARRFEPIFHLAQQYAAMMFIHSGFLPNDTSLPPENNVDNGAERRGTLDMQSRLSSIMLTLCLTDFLKPYPDVTVQLHNLGGNIPFEIERLDHISMDRTPNARTPSAKIRDSRILVDCNSMGARGIERAVEVYGAERILFGSDGTRFGMQWTSNAIADANLSEAQRDMIRTTNARSVLRRVGRAVSVAA